MNCSLRSGLKRYFDAKQLKLLSNTPVGIAGAGGIGSNVAMMLARSGLERLVIIDRDVIEPSNLNRQHYWPDQLGLAKVDAIATHLGNLNANIALKSYNHEISETSLCDILPQAQIWVEALDNAEIKKIFVEKALLAGCKVAAVSGIAGYGGQPMRKRKMGNLVVVGDFETDAGEAPTLAPRVIQAASLLADTVLEFILGPKACNRE